MKLSSVRNQFELLFSSRPLRLRKPKVIQFPVIDICNSQCQMCRIWENKKSQDITLEELNKGLSSELFTDVQSIGFNGGEPTLRKDLPELVKTCVDKLPSLRNVSLITNAIKTEQVIQQVSNIAACLEPHNISFDVMVSLDGYREVHDNVRGREGNFSSAVEVLKMLKKIPGVDSIRVGCTIIKENVLYLRDLLDFCIENDFYVKFRLGIPHQRLYTENLTEPYYLDFKEKYELTEFLHSVVTHYEKDPSQKFFYLSLIDQIIDDAPRKAGCAWQFQGATITAKGELAYCAVKSNALMDNIAQGDAKQVYFSNQHHLQDIVNHHCDNCHHDYVGPPAAEYYRKLFLERLIESRGLRRKLQRVPLYATYQEHREKRLFHKERSLLKLESTSLASELDKAGEVKPKKVFICGWYGTETLGDKAILASLIQDIKHIMPDANISVVSLNKYISYMSCTQMEELSEIEVLSTKEAIGAIKSACALIFGGGPLMAIPSLSGIEVLFEQAKQHNVKTISAGVGVGPLGRSWLNESIANILNLSDYRSFRDEKSKSEASRLGIDTHMDIVSVDPSLNWLSEKARQISPLRKQHNNKKVLVLGLRAFPHKQYAYGQSLSQRLNTAKQYEDIVVNVLHRLAENLPELIIKPLPMSTNHFGDDDRWFYRRIFRSAAINKTQLDFSLLDEEKTPEEYLGHFLGADALLAMRFHSIIFGLASGLVNRTVAIDYTLGKGKVDTLTRKYDIPSINIDSLTSDSLYRLLSNTLSKSKTPKRRISERNLMIEFLEQALDGRKGLAT